MSIHLEQLERIAADAGLEYRKCAYQPFHDKAEAKALYDAYMNALRDVEKEKEALLNSRRQPRAAQNVGVRFGK